MRKLLNVIGLFIFGGIALTLVTSPVYSDEIGNFLLFFLGSASIYYLLVNIYFQGGLWRKVFFAALLILGGFSIVMAIYLSTNPIPH
ncbi:hypothetical protein [Bacillus dakarensis]|uniref:hypothetical protein n=1 Tax=Robertmurraya dakarensis TaxID=1926278 RepID=UPI001F1B8466|nr:hypothetical protein [Bacillus dakarensis]